MISPHLVGVFFGLASALTWGAGDLSGGVASRRSNQFRVLFITAVTGLIILAALALLRSEPLPEGFDLLLAAVAGVSGAFGILTLYLGLSLGNAAIVMPTSAVVSIITPVTFSFFIEGLPGVTTIIGIRPGHRRGLAGLQRQRGLRGGIAARLLARFPGRARIRRLFHLHFEGGDGRGLLKAGHLQGRGPRAGPAPAGAASRKAAALTENPTAIMAGVLDAAATSSSWRPSCSPGWTWLRCYRRCTP